MTICEQIRRERERQGITLSELANKSGVCRNTLINLENDLRSPRIDTLMLVVEALGMQLRMVPCGNMNK